MTPDFLANLRRVSAAVLVNLEPGTEPKAKTGSRLTVQCRGRVVLATLMGKFVRDEYAALIHGHVSQECHLKFAEQNRTLCRLGKSVGSRAVRGRPTGTLQIPDPLRRQGTNQESTGQQPDRVRRSARQRCGAHRPDDGPGRTRSRTGNNET